MSLDEAFTKFDEEKEEIFEWLKNEIVPLRTGRIKPDLIESITVEHYGARTPLNGLATISNADARSLAVSPWDPQAVPSIEKALVEAQLGVQPSVDGDVIRLSFPPLTEEVREQTVKLLQKKAEEARIRSRRSRDESLKILTSDKQKSDITEDDFYDSKDDLQKRIDDINKSIDQMVENKESEIRAI